MGGGLMQLVAKGAQDAAIEGNPTVTFFKITFKKFAPFAEEAIEQTFSGPADFGKRVTCTISRNADLIKGVKLQVTLPSQSLTISDAKFRWLNYIGFRLIKKFEVEIGGQTIDRQYGEWLYIWYQLTCPVGSRRNMEEMIGNTHDLVLMKNSGGIPLDSTCSTSEVTNSCMARSGTPSKTLYIPLNTLWFCRNPGLALPLIALQYHDVKINIEFANFYECAYWEGTSYTPTKNMVAASLYVDYVYLDTDERRTVSQKEHTYLIEQLQQPGGETLTSSVYKAKLNFNHPCKALIWVVQRDSFVQCADPPNSVSSVAAAGGTQPFNFTDDWNTDGLIHDALGKPDLAVDEVNGITSYGSTTAANLGLGTELFVDATDASGTDGPTAIITGTTNYLFAKVLLESGVKCEGKNPVEVAKITLNGHDRFSEREGRYFDKLQVLEHFSGSGATGINVYCAGLRPEEWQPSGTINMSRIDTANLHLTLSVNTVRDQRTATLRVYAINYNFLKIVSGMGGNKHAPKCAAKMLCKFVMKSATACAA
jgi:hypothetical protein